MLSEDRIRKTIEGRGMSADSIRSIAYLLAGRGVGAADSAASAIGRRLAAGHILQDELELLMFRTSDLNLSVDDDVDAFCAADATVQADNS